MAKATALTQADITEIMSQQFDGKAVYTPDNTRYAPEIAAGDITPKAVPTKYGTWHHGIFKLSVEQDGKIVKLKAPIEAPTRDRKVVNTKISYNYQRHIALEGKVYANGTQTPKGKVCWFLVPVKA